MGSEWILTPFKDVLDGGTRNGVYKPKEFHGTGVKIINMGELFAYPRLTSVPMKRLQLADGDLEKSTIQSGDLLFARRSLVAEGAGKCSIVLEVNEPTTFESSIIRARPNPHIADSLYLFYFFSSPKGRHLMGTILRQVAVSGITGSDLGNLPIPLPPLPEQRAIAAVLGALDDKIELNRRMNGTLEALARALFRSWFVDFEPVRGRGDPPWLPSSPAMEGRHAPAPEGRHGGSEGRHGGLPLPPDIAALFPDEMEVGEDGVERPRGWEIKAIGDIAKVVGGSTPSTKEPRYWDNGEYYWTTPKDLSSLSVPLLLGSERKITKAGLSQISSGLLPVGTILLSSRAPIGYLAIAEVPTAINQGFIALLPRNDISNLFLLLWAREAQEEILSRANGSTFLEISKSNFRPIKLVIPPDEIMKIFDNLARPIYERLVSNEKESRTLAALRDGLLPKLMSGAVRVSNVEYLFGVV